VKFKRNDAKLLWSLTLGLFVLYFAICYKWLFVLTAPSDPLMYMEPALFPADGFPYFDRILLWLWLRAFSILPVGAEKIGGIATLTTTSLILSIGFWWLGKKVNLLAASMFAFLFILSKWILMQATYTYPSAMMTLVLISTLVLMDSVSESRKFFVAGFGFAFAIISKVQAYTFLPLICFLAIYDGSPKDVKIRRLFQIFIGIVLGTAVIIVSLGFWDGFDVWAKLYNLYFSAGMVTKQVVGRAHGGVPAFYKYLSVVVVLLSFVGAVAAVFLKRFKKVFVFGLAALIQAAGLLMIYIVTRRGGPLIPNYSLDAHVFGIIAFAGCFSLYLEQEKWTSMKRSIPLSIILLVSSLLIITIFSLERSSGIKLSTAQALIGGASILIIALIVIFLLIREDLVKTKWRVAGFVIAILISSLIVKQSTAGIERAIFLKERFGLFHYLANYLQESKLEGKIWVQIFRGYKLETGDAVVRKLFKIFYAHKESVGREFVFGKKEKNVDYIITADKRLMYETGLCTPRDNAKDSDVYLITTATKDCVLLFTISIPISYWK